MTSSLHGELYLCEDALTPYCVGALLCVCCVFVLWRAILVIKLCISSSLMSRLSWWLIWCVYSVVAFDHGCVDLSLQVMMPASHATDAPRFCVFAPDVLCLFFVKFGTQCDAITKWLPKSWHVERTLRHYENCAEGCGRAVVLFFSRFFVPLVSLSSENLMWCSEPDIMRARDDECVTFAVSDIK